MEQQWTENRKKVARFLESYFDANNRAPSLDEIALGTGLWKRSVEIVLKGLEKIGFIEITPGISRGICIVDRDSTRIPILGEVQAGVPAFGQETAVDFLKLDKNLVPFEDPVALRVNGFSMKDSGILPGDIVLLRNQQTADNGETVVAYFNGGLTVKKLSRSGRRVFLQSSNPAYKPMEVGKDDEFYIVGKVMLVLRDVGGCLDFKIETPTRS